MIVRGLDRLLTNRMVKLRCVLMVFLSVFAASVAAALPVTETLSWQPKLVYRQIGGGYTLALEKNRQPKTFFLCGPAKTDCITTTEIGWRKPFIVFRNGNLVRPSGNVLDTTGRKHSGSAQHFNSVRRYPTAVAWEKLSPTKPLW
jgi:hypothetical protein